MCGSNSLGNIVLTQLLVVPLNSSWSTIARVSIGSSSHNIGRRALVATFELTARIYVPEHDVS